MSSNWLKEFQTYIRQGKPFEEACTACGITQDDALKELRGQEGAETAKVAATALADVENALRVLKSIALKTKAKDNVRVAAAEAQIDAVIKLTKLKMISRQPEEEINSSKLWIF